jgi:hypothetical protein
MLQCSISKPKMESQFPVSIPAMFLVNKLFYRQGGLRELSQS